MRVFREDGAVEEAGENDTLIVKRLAADPEAFGIFDSASSTRTATKFRVDHRRC